MDDLAEGHICALEKVPLPFLDTFALQTLRQLTILVDSWQLFTMDGGCIIHNLGSGTGYSARGLGALMI